MQELASKWCSLHNGNGHISISTSTGYRRSAYDPNGFHIVIDASCSDEELGNAIVQSLSSSKPLLESEIRDFFKLDNIEKNYSIFVSRLLEGMGNISRAKAFRKLKLCSINVKGSIVTFSPSKKERGEAWSGSGFNETDKISVDYGESPAELGRIAKQVLAICK